MMHNYKYLVLSDLDGTLLNSQGELSKETIKYVHELNKRTDIIFAFSTGRSWDDSKHIYEQLQLKGFVSCCNGAFVHNPHENLTHYSFLSSKCWELFLGNPQFFVRLKRGIVLSDKGSFDIDINGGKDLIKKLKEIKANVFCIKAYYKYDQITPQVHKEDTDRFNLLKELDSAPAMSIFYYPGELNLELQAHYVNKERTVEFLGAYYGVSYDNTLTFGDQHNDYSVSRGVSNFWAVQNAIDMVKQKAKHISNFTNDEHAVVKELAIFLDNK